MPDPFIRQHLGEPKRERGLYMGCPSSPKCFQMEHRKDVLQLELKCVGASFQQEQMKSKIRIILGPFGFTICMRRWN